MARLGSWYGLAAWAALAAAVGCSNTGTPCKKRGATEACSCGDAKGSRVCLPERVWDECDCSAGASMDAGGTGGAPGSGGTGTGGSGTGGTSGTSGSGGAGNVPPNTMGNKDGGNAADAMVAAGQDGGGSGGGGAGDAGGMGGSGGMVAPPGNAYGKCMEDGDCKVADSLCNIVAGLPPLSEDSSGCQPPCQETGDCPVPAGNYDATVTCVDGHCDLDCTPPDPLGDNRSCPGGLTCTASLLATFSCLAP